MAVILRWRGAFSDAELNGLHAEAFGDPGPTWKWTDALNAHSLGWVVARRDEQLVGFVNVVTDGGSHAWLQDTMVALSERGHGVGTDLVALARRQAREAGCRWLHADYEDGLRHFYEDGCGFRPTRAGLIDLS